MFVRAAFNGHNGWMQEYGERLRARAKELGLTDVQVARRLGLAQGRYANYVNGNREPDLKLFVRICEVLITTPNEILGVDLSERPSQDALRSRALVSLAAIEGTALKAAVILLEALALKREDLEG